MNGKAQRLSKWLVQLGYCETRREAESFLDNHTVLAGDEPVTRPDVKVLPEDITIDGEKMDGATLLIMLNKPAGYVCSHEDSGLRVYDLLPDRWRRRQPKIVTVGRLDKDTTGLLLLTDDGPMLHKLTHPKHHVAKLYEVELQNPLSGKEAALFASGTLMLENEDKPLLPAEMEVTGSNSARLSIHEGRFHQVKRMFGATGNEVTRLHRSQMGRLSLGNLPEGQWRLITDEDMSLLFSS